MWEGTESMPGSHGAEGAWTHLLSQVLAPMPMVCSAQEADGAFFVESVRSPRTASSSFYPQVSQTPGLCSPCMWVPSAEACLALNRWDWAEVAIEGQLKLNLVSEVCIPFCGVGGGKWK